VAGAALGAAPATGRHPDIPSAVTDAEAGVLASLAEGGTVLELGAQFGFSTVVLAQAARVVHSVDWHRGDAEAGWTDSLPTFAENLRRHDVADSVVVHVGAFAAVLPLLAAGRFDLVFVDGAHDFASVAGDVAEALRLVKPGGAVALHDWGRFEVAAAVRSVTDLPADVTDHLGVIRP
jgi:predicted O-methyltransferase YrrM